MRQGIGPLDLCDSRCSWRLSHSPMKNWLIKLLGGYTREEVTLRVEHVMPQIRGALFAVVGEVFRQIDLRNPRGAPKSKAKNKTVKQFSAMLVKNATRTKKPKNETNPSI